MTEITALAAAIMLAVSFFDLRKGVYLTLAAGFLQDPIRKLLPGEPVQVTAFVALLAIAVFAGSYLRGRNANFRAIPGWKHFVVVPFRLFVGVVALQSLMGVVNTGSAIVGVIGLLAYLVPVIAAAISILYCQSPRDIERVLWVYVALCLGMTSGLYLSQFGQEWDILRTVGEPLFVYPLSGGEQALPAGFFRAPETAGWHAAMAVCILTLLVVSGRSVSLNWAGAILIPVFLGAVVFAGRRKYLYEVLAFIFIYGSMLIYVQRGGGKMKLVLFGLLSGAIAVGAMTLGYYGDDPLEIALRPGDSGEAEGVVGMALARVLGNSIESFGYVIDENGFFGSGAGTGSQGAQHFGETITGLSSEGGFAKVLAELGVPGILIACWLLFNVARLIWSLLKRLGAEQAPVVRMTCGIIAVLVANGFVFVGAHQIFGDPFVLILLGFLLGCVLWLARLGISGSGTVPCERPPLVANVPEAITVGRQARKPE